MELRLVLAPGLWLVLDLLLSKDWVEALNHCLNFVTFASADILTSIPWSLICFIYYCTCSSILSIYIYACSLISFIYLLAVLRISELLSLTCSQNLALFVVELITTFTDSTINNLVKNVWFEVVLNHLINITYSVSERRTQASAAPHAFWPRSKTSLNSTTSHASKSASKC